MMHHTKGIESVLELIFVHEGYQFLHLDGFGVSNVSPSSEDLFSFSHYEVVHNFLRH